MAIWYDNRGRPSYTPDKRKSPRKRAPETKTRFCVTCGLPFQATRSRQGRFATCCSKPCRLAALGRLIETLTRNYDALAAEIAAEAAAGGAEPPKAA